MMNIMASSSAVKYLNRPNFTVILILITLSLIPFFSSNSAETTVSKRNDHIDKDGLKRMKTVLGSKPPRCANKCLSCRPCMAALVIYQHRSNGNNNSNGDRKESPRERENGYYLLAWKCKCRNKIFQP